MKLHGLRGCSRTIRNLTSIDQALPDDVLYMVLEQACVVPQEVFPPWQLPSFTSGLSTFSSDAARTLSSVCRRWRQLLSNPIVWSDVSVFTRSVEGMHWVDTCLSRSKHMKSMVRIGQPAKRRCDRGIGIPAVVARHQSKIRGLYLRIGAVSDFDFMNTEMVNLERLHLADSSLPGGNHPTAFSLAKFPELRMLILEGGHLFSAKELMHITDLTLDSCTFLIDLSTIFAVAPIEKLRLRKVPIVRGNVKAVPNLKLLVIESTTFIEILTALPALPTTVKVYIHDQWTPSTRRSRLGMLPIPYSIFGDRNPVYTVSVSIHLRMVSFVLHTSNGGRTEVITEAAPGITDDSARAFVKALFADIGTRSVLINACSMEINVHPTATHLICENTINHLLSAASWITQLFLRGPLLFHHVCNALSSDQDHGRLLPGLASLNMNLCRNDSFLEDLPLLNDVVASRPAMWKIAFSGTEKQTRSILKEYGLFAERLQDQGIRVLLLTSSPLSM